MGVKLTKRMLNRAYELAFKGFSHKQVCESVGINRTSLYHENYKDLYDIIKKGEQDLREEVTNTILMTLSDDTSMRIFLSKRLNLFHSEYKLPKITTADQALREISNLNIALSEGTIPIELHSSLLKGINDYLKSYEVTQLEERLTKIEKAIEDDKQK